MDPSVLRELVTELCMIPRGRREIVTIHVLAEVCEENPEIFERVKKSIAATRSSIGMEMEGRIR